MDPSYVFLIILNARLATAGATVQRTLHYADIPNLIRQCPSTGTKILILTRADLTRPPPSGAFP